MDKKATTSSERPEFEALAWSMSNHIERLKREAKLILEIADGEANDQAVSAMLSTIDDLNEIVANLDQSGKD